MSNQDGEKSMKRYGLPKVLAAVFAVTVPVVALADGLVNIVKLDLGTMMLIVGLILALAGIAFTWWALLSGPRKAWVAVIVMVVLLLPGALFGAGARDQARPVTVLPTASAQSTSLRATTAPDAGWQMVKHDTFSMNDGWGADFDSPDPTFNAWVASEGDRPRTADVRYLYSQKFIDVNNNPAASIKKVDRPNLSECLNPNGYVTSVSVESSPSVCVRTTEGNLVGFQVFSPSKAGIGFTELMLWKRS